MNFMKQFEQLNVEEDGEEKQHEEEEEKQAPKEMIQPQKPKK